MNIREAIESALLSKSLKMDAKIRRESDSGIVIRTINTPGFHHMVLCEHDANGPQHVVLYISDQKLVGDDWYTEVKQGDGKWNSTE